MIYPRVDAQQELLLPVKPGFIAATLIAAFLLSLLPWTGGWQWVRPDFVALFVLFWSIDQPRKVGFLVAWLLGLLVDIADASLFGQHALAYSILAYAGIVLHRRVLRFSMAPQVLHVIPLLLMTDLAALLVRLVAGADFPGWQYFIGSFVGGALWPLLTILLRLPQWPKPDPDHV